MTCKNLSFVFDASCSAMIGAQYTKADKRILSEPPLLLQLLYHTFTLVRYKRTRDRMSYNKSFYMVKVVGILPFSLYV